MAVVAVRALESEPVSRKIEVLAAVRAGHVGTFLWRDCPRALPLTVYEELEGVVQPRLGEGSVRYVADGLLHREAGMMNPRQRDGRRAVPHFSLDHPVDFPGVHERVLPHVPQVVHAEHARRDLDEGNGLLAPHGVGNDRLSAVYGDDAAYGAFLREIDAAGLGKQGAAGT